MLLSQENADVDHKTTTTIISNVSVRDRVHRLEFSPWRASTRTIGLLILSVSTSRIGRLRFFRPADVLASRPSSSFLDPSARAKRRESVELDPPVKKQKFSDEAGPHRGCVVMRPDCPKSDEEFVLGHLHDPLPSTSSYSTAFCPFVPLTVRTDTEALSVAATSTVPSASVETESAVRQRLIASPYSLVASGLLATEALASTLIWDQWLCTLANSLSACQWQTYWQNYASIYGIGALPTHLLSFFNQPLFNDNLSRLRTQEMHNAYGWFLHSFTYLSSCYTPPVPLKPSRCQRRSIGDLKPNMHYVRREWT
uniref:Uncharacterized protein n=1 Tax=Steinernema glaseri TaxID=37863 RepID=A0A1I8AWJ3_9BILA